MSWFFGGEGTIESVVDQTAETAFTPSTRDDVKWEEPSYSSVETQTFYLLSDDGHVLTLQMIYSSVRFAFTTRQFTVKILYPAAADGSAPPEPFWSSRPIDKQTPAPALADLDSNATAASGPDGTAAAAAAAAATGTAGSENAAYFDKQFETVLDADVVLNPSGDTFAVRSRLTEDAPEVNFEFSRLTDGLVIGNNGISSHKTGSRLDGHIRHVFWPRCAGAGSITFPDGRSVRLSGKAIFIHALQGMMPNHAASRWNFLGFMSPSYTAIAMEFTGTDYYKNAVVTVGMVTSKDGVAVAGGCPAVKVTDAEVDPETEWETPTAIRWQIDGAAKPDGVKTSAVIEGAVDKYSSRVDVLGELPTIAKTVVASLSGVKPFVYQYVPQMAIKVTTTKDGSETTVEEAGTALYEASFIS